MITKRLLLALIGVTALVFSWAFAAVPEYQLAALALGNGVVWFVLENYRQSSPASLFFSLFVGLAVLGSLGELSAPVMVFGLTTSLAAWDLARFRARVMAAGPACLTPAFEIRHLQKLAAVTGAGFVIALLPLAATIPMNFIPLAVIMLLTMLILRSAVRHLRRDAQRNL